jgi:hypothetical protein
MWLAKAKKYFPKSNNIIIRWFDEIIAYFDNRTTSGAVEGITALPAIMQYSFSPCPLLSKLSDLGMYLIAAVSAVSPYSPDFSPIENCWSKVKEFLRRRNPPQASLAARTYLELDEAITNALNAVTKKDIIGWFTHCCYCIAPN